MAFAVSRGQIKCGQEAHREGASKNSVPLMITRCAGVFTPHAKVLVATSTCRSHFLHSKPLNYNSCPLSTPAVLLPAQSATYLHGDRQHSPPTCAPCICMNLQQRTSCPTWSTGMAPRGVLTWILLATKSCSTMLRSASPRPAWCNPMPKWSVWRRLPSCNPGTP